MVTLDQVFDDTLFFQSVILLVIGAFFSVGVGSWLNYWFESRRKKREIEVENNKKKLEIKVDMVSKMAGAIAHQQANAFKAVNIQKKELNANEIDARYEDVQKWFTQVNAIRLKLESYFPKTDMAEKWRDYFDTLYSFSNISQFYFYENLHEDQKSSLKRNLQVVKDYFSRNSSIKNKVDWDSFTSKMKYDEKLYSVIYSMFTHRGDDIIREILNLPIKVF